MTIFDVKQPNPHHGVGAYNETIKRMQAFELPQTIEKQMIQLLVSCDISNTVLEGLTPTDQLTLSCLLTKIRESQKIYPTKPKTLITLNQVVIDAYNKENEI